MQRFFCGFSSSQIKSNIPHTICSQSFGADFLSHLESSYKNAITNTPNLVGKTLSSGCGTTKVIHTALLSLYIYNAIALLRAQLYHYYTMGVGFLKRMLSPLRCSLPSFAISQMGAAIVYAANCFLGSIRLVILTL